MNLKEPGDKTGEYYILVSNVRSPQKFPLKFLTV